MKAGHATRAATLFEAALLILVLLLPAARPLGATEQPLSKDEVTVLLLSGATSEKLLRLIQERGVNFRMDPDLAQRFHDAGASDQAIEALQKAGERARSGSSAGEAGKSEGPAPRSAETPPPPAVAPPKTPTPESSADSTEVSTEEKIQQIMQQLEVSPIEPSGEYPLAPTFSVSELSGMKIDLGDFKGKVVLLDFWATWCGPCRSEIPGFVRLQQKYRDQGFSIIGIAVSDHQNAVREFYRRYRMNYTVAMGDRKLRKLYGGIGGLPTTFLIGRDGRIYHKFLGAVNAEALEGKIRTLLAGAIKMAQHSPEKPSTVAATGTASPPRESSPTAQGPGTAGGERPETSSASSSNVPSTPKTKVNLSDPSPDQMQKIIEEFAAKEKLFKVARNNYTYHQTNKVQELGPDGEVVGVYEEEWDILYDDKGDRIERVTYAPVSSLKSITVTQQDTDSFRNIQPFVLTSEELLEYDVKYLGHVKVDEITAYVFSIRPKEIKKGRQYFQGVVWVDDRDLQIVKSQGKSVPEMKTKKGENLFPRFTTYREQIDGKFWFPTFTLADDTLYFSSAPVHVRQIIKYSEYKQFKASSTVKIVTELPSSTPEKPSKPSSPK